MEKTQEAYIDSNIFIYSIVSQKEEGQACRQILQKVVSGIITAYTSALTFDEVFWKIQKLSNKQKALEATQNMLIIPNLVFLAVDINTITAAHKIIKDFDLDPRDAIHASCCLLNKIPIIISEDPDFDKLDFLKRKSVKQI